MKKSGLLLVLIALGISLFWTSCKKADETNSGKTARVNFYLTDGPGDYDAVYINVREVQVQVDNGGWQTIAVAHPGTLNLLDLRNGIDSFICTGYIPVGHITQMRLVLNDGNTVVVNGTSHALTTPSAQESGLKININETLQADVAYDIWIDFDAGKSIHETGSGKYMLKPVMRGYTKLTDGRIKGFVTPPGIDAVVYVVKGTDTLSAIPTTTGYFMFCGLESGTYTVIIDSNDPLYADKTITNI